MGRSLTVMTQNISQDAIAAAFSAALDLARDQMGNTAPNPSVGCVLLDQGGEVLASAAHFGLPHAEVRAITQAQSLGVADRIHTVVVTLEPCNHTGRTGPCSHAILATSAQALWYALPDPTAQAAGGAAHLAAAGLDVRSLDQLDHPQQDALLSDAHRLIAPFLTRITKHRPFVTVKQALDGQGSMIPPAGQKTFTGPQALQLAHELRRRADAIMTGSGTILADHPAFNVRHVADFAGKSRILAILDRRGRVCDDYLRAAKSRGLRPMIVTDLAQALADLADMGCNEVLVEAGPSILDSLAPTDLWDEWVLIRHSQSGDDITISNNISRD
jgi:diaminohydroxyphosphoribosylaminopyrimidine deaminase / 5-amino-6-(5-phosphoribosylamino)uracil reductase